MTAEMLDKSEIMPAKAATKMWKFRWRNRKPAGSEIIRDVISRLCDQPSSNKPRVFTEAFRVLEAGRQA